MTHDEPDLSETRAFLDAEPTCDICGHTMESEPETPWNGETGNHVPCEESKQLAERILRLTPSQLTAIELLLDQWDVDRFARDLQAAFPGEVVVYGLPEGPSFMDGIIDLAERDR